MIKKIIIALIILAAATIIFQACSPVRCAPRRLHYVGY
jgi:hypothetical protein